MGLVNFYSLRNNFTVIGLTGRSGGGCNDICNFLKLKTNPFKGGRFVIPKNLHVNEIQKFNICKNLLINESNPWRAFSVMKYRDVLMLFFFKELGENIENNFDNLTLDVLLETFERIYDCNTVKTRRLGQDENSDNITLLIFNYLRCNLQVLNDLNDLFAILNGSVNYDSHEDAMKSIQAKKLNTLFFENYSKFSEDLFSLIDKVDPVARQLFLQDIAWNLRTCGQVFFLKTSDISSGTEFIFTVANAIKNIIKINRKAIGWNKVVIDSLKNSLEINFFRERYAGFYLIASSRDEEQANSYLEAKINKMGFEFPKVQIILKKLKAIDNAHYQTKDFKTGNFTTPDLENCIQKADYYIYVEKNPKTEPIKYKHDEFRYLSLEIQLLKFLALVNKPGIVTPSAFERSMQLAFSSKYNSGCISRQVGAVVTDSNYSVKSLGWNEVPQGQTPCSLRSLKELVSEKRINVYSEYEKEGGDYSGKSFKEKVKETLLENYGNEENFFENLDGHNCPYCFKDFHNSFEGKENQVHTRSLHAEENAMLQISKFGGQGLTGGVLFTTASPCELCSKKAYQLGIKKVFYIDPYPGIARQQILKAGNNIENNPQLFMFQGAVGRGFFKLYEPYMSIKDETYIRTGIKPKVSDDKLFLSMKEQLLNKFPHKLEIQSISSYDELVNIIEKGLDLDSK